MLMLMLMLKSLPLRSIAFAHGYSRLLLSLINYCHRTMEKSQHHAEEQHNEASLEKATETSKEALKQPERRVKVPPPPPTGARAFVDRQFGFVLKVLGVI